MADRLIQVIGKVEQIDAVADCLKEMPPDQWWRLPYDKDEGRQSLYVALFKADAQDVMDAISEALEGQEGWRLFSLPTEASLPELDDEEEENRLAQKETVSAREEIYRDVRQGTALTMDYLVMTALAALVAAIGLSQGQVAVVIGAMVIAPLLGPIMAFAFATALGNFSLLGVAARALGAGLAVATGVGIVLGLILPGSYPDTSMMDFSGVLSLQTVALPLAGGAAAALMLAGGQTTGLVGVMVAAALLPPLAAFGLLVGIWDIPGALRALATVVTNIVAINLAAQVVFVAKGIRPRRWEDSDHRTSVRVALGASGALVALMALALWLAGHGYVPGL
ncbi:MAG: TIGR00341 family protein [Vannielia sp.]|uniref:TIGR00341 family protein n=1 Tax=Rhodobacterales TaxID=204455 RepID=UPI00209468D1|nr:TIGR00341 family protein [Oceanicola sp. 502str15]MCO6384597.1 TIGR00341 family protein [Oceanicola sp. 502str15]